MRVNESACDQPPADDWRHFIQTFEMRFIKKELMSALIRHQNSHSATSFKSRRSVCRSSGVMRCRTVSSAATLAMISLFLYLVPLLVIRT